MLRTLLAPLLALSLLLVAPAPATARAILWYDDGWGKPVYFPSEPALNPPPAPALAAGPAAAPEPGEPPTRDGFAVVEGLWAVLALIWVGSCLIAAAALTPRREPPRPTQHATPRRERLSLVDVHRAARPTETTPPVQPARLLRRQQSRSPD